MAGQNKNAAAEARRPALSVSGQVARLIDLAICGFPESYEGNLDEPNNNGKSNSGSSQDLPKAEKECACFPPSMYRPMETAHGWKVWYEEDRQADKDWRLVTAVWNKAVIDNWRYEWAKEQHAWDEWEKQERWRDQSARRGFLASESIAILKKSLAAFSVNEPPRQFTAEGCIKSQEPPPLTRLERCSKEAKDWKNWRDYCFDRTCPECGRLKSETCCQEPIHPEELISMLRSLAGINPSESKAVTIASDDVGKGKAGFRVCGPQAWDNALRASEEDR